MVQCFCCDTEFQFGAHIYAGKHIPGYQLTVCRACCANNRDGWAPQLEGKILTPLENKDLVVLARNALGLLPRNCL